MIILDTNVLSEAMKPRPDSRVLAWLGNQSVPSLFTTSISQTEIVRGILALSAGRRRKALESAADTLFTVMFSGRVLPFAPESAGICARIAVDRRRSGRPISHADAQIAAIARGAGARLATRNVKDFEDCGLILINPWH